MMKLNRSMMVIVGIGLFVLSGCASGDKKVSKKVSETPSNLVLTAPAQPATGHDATINEGGQVIESGAYHLELVPVPEPDVTHLDLFLQKGDNHEAIPDAKVTAEVDFPDGTHQSLEMEYDAQGKHYMTILSTDAAGDYKVAILSDINGEKVNGRFTFSR
jgi:hypothetical protein